jgi:hypothetical protein
MRKEHNERIHKQINKQRSKYIICIVVLVFSFVQLIVLRLPRLKPDLDQDTTQQQHNQIQNK